MLSFGYCVQNLSVLKRITAYFNSFSSLNPVIIISKEDSTRQENKMILFIIFPNRFKSNLFLRNFEISSPFYGVRRKAFLANQISWENKFNNCLKKGEKNCDIVFRIAWDARTERRRLSTSQYFFLTYHDEQVNAKRPFK